MLPIFVVEVPPFGFEDAEALVFHGVAEKVATGSLFGGASGVGAVGAGRHFVVDAGHFDFATGLDIVESEIDGAAAIVAGPFSRVGNEFVLIGRSGVPKDLRDGPRAVGIEDEQAVALLEKGAVGAEEGFGGGPLAPILFT